ncbi:GNAT family N-acetyltransferase [Myxococcota bacterium]|nr:GNAT family N-acetyltransferase [Myxococcota bacterium]
MRIVDLGAEHEPAYLSCLEDWAEEAALGRRHRAAWLERMKTRGLRVKIALDDAERPIGFIQSVPSEHAPITGRELYFVLCIWVHGHARGIGDQQGRGVGSALLAAAEEDARRLGAKALVAWGLVVPTFMRASWFKRHGYVRVDRQGLMALMWKPFTPQAESPRWLRATKRPAIEPDHVVITACHNGWCLAEDATLERLIRCARHHGGDVELRVIDTCCDRATIEAWGTTSAVFVDDRPLRTGPPPSMAKIEAVVARQLRRRHISRAPEPRPTRDPSAR